MALNNLWKNKIGLATTALMLSGCASAYVSPSGVSSSDDPTIGQTADNPYAATCTPPLAIGREYRDAAGQFGVCIQMQRMVGPIYPYALSVVPGTNIVVLPPGGFWAPLGSRWERNYSGGSWGGGTGVFVGGHVGVGIQGTNPISGRNYRAGASVSGLNHK